MTENPFTEMENAVLEAYANGCQDARQVADKLIMSRRTVHVHLSKMYQKTDTHTIVSLMILALNNEWLKLPTKSG